jgi:hypothetical protein
MSNENEQDFVSVSLKKDVAEQIEKICQDAKQYDIFVSKSALLRVMIFNHTIVEYSIKQIISNRHNDKS